MSDSLTHKAARGTVWATVDRMGSMLLQFLFNLLLARLLTPADYGAVGMLAIFIAVSNVLIDGGFASALIQKKDPTQQDWSTVFFWNLGVSIALYGILYAASPLVAAYFRMPALRGVLRGIGLTLILGALASIQLTRLRKQFAFRTIAIANISAYIVGGSIATAMALWGCGVWSLVAMQIIMMAVTCVIYAVLTRWCPAPVFSFSTLRTLFGYGGYLLGANILQEIAKNLQGFIIGRRFSPGIMGYYTQAYKLDRITSYSLPQVIVQVMFPVYASLQDDLTALRLMLLRNVRVIGFLIFPIMGILIFVAPELLTLLYGEKWLPAAPYFRILCVAGMFACLQNINYYAVAARGKSRTLFVWSFWKWGFMLAALLVGVELGDMYGLLWAMVVSEANIYVVNASLAARHTGLSIFKQLIALCPILGCVAAAYGIAFLGQPYTGTFLGALLLLIVFLVTAKVTRLAALADSIALIRKIIHR